MQLLLPDSELAGISVEGLEPAAQSYASAETVEVADIAVFYGQRATFAGAKRVEIIQFKYSVSRAETEFRAFDAKKTIQKFAAAYRDYKRTFGVTAIEKKLTFELITNRPILPELVDAINGLASGLTLSGEAKKQATQFKTAAGLTGKDLKRFAGRCVVSGLTGNLHRTKSDLRRLIVDWSATPSALTTSRIGQVRQLVRNKAGSEGAHGKNVIRRVDLYEALGIEGLDDLLPCPESLPEIGAVVPREQLPKAIASIPVLDKPLLVHGDGGIGKTVFLDSLAAALSDQSEVVFFDCFGSGRYRTAEDSRHLPNRGLVHIVNTLACRGLCDPLLPGSDSQETLFKIFRKRLKQCIAALHWVSPDRRLVLFLDAIDNAAEHANDRGESSFPTLLLESLENDPIDGLRLIVSCRTYRRKRAVKDVQCQEIHLRPFTFQESKKYILDRKPTASESEINVAQARSNGNGRILEHLLTGDRGLLDPSELGKPIKLDELLQDRIDKALREAIKRGSRKRDIDAFLAGLAVLPPPVPIAEYAGAHDIDVSAIESFAADLAPLLDNTNQGMMFRDEPTESLVRDKYAADVSSLKRVATRLNARQDESVYAARTLPGLLLKIRDGNKLFKLAFDDRAPPALSSTVGRRRIQFERLQAAAMHAADTTNYDKLVQLLVAMSTIAAADQKGADYILDNPDLTVSAQDAEAMRRLFETRTNWPGARHARLTIANLLSEDLDDAHRHFQGAQEWIIHELNRDKDQFRDRDRGGPERLDHASLPAFLIAQGDPSRAIRFMRIWLPWYSHELSGHIFSILGFATQPSALKPDIDGYLDGLGNEIGCLTGALGFLNLQDGQRRTLIEKLARACVRRTDIKHNDQFSRQQSNDLADGLQKSAAMALHAGLSKEALKISLRAPHARPQVWSFRDQMMDKHVFGFLFRVALVAAAKGKSVHELDILPSDLAPIARGIPRSAAGQSFRERLAKRVDAKLAKDREEEDHDRRIGSEFKASVERFLHDRIELVLNLTNAFSLVLSAPNGRVDKPFKQLVDLWHAARSKTTYYTTHEVNLFFNVLGATMAAFAIAVRQDLKAASIRKYLTQWHKYPLGASMLVEMIRVLALRPRLTTLAGEQAIRAADYIERDDDVPTRAALYSDLARSIHPANKDDAVAFFRRGMEQLDAIGSGDHDFTSELLLFASELKGDELKEPEFHTLTNICELNMSYEPEKFPWASFGAGMSKASGLRGLAKLCRWQERSKIDLEYTLLPYLTALIRDDKIRPEDAIALNWVADPAELWSCNTETFANAIHEKSYGNTSQIFEELIRQFEAQNPRIVAKSTVEALGQISREVFGARHATTKYLKAASSRFATVIDELNKQSNYRPKEDRALYAPRERREYQTVEDARQIADRTNPLDEDSLFDGIAELDKEQPGREREDAFLKRLRARVQANDRSTYLRNIVAASNLDYYAKYTELEKAKTLWASSSASFRNTLRELAIPLVREHASEFISYERLSGYEIRKISTLTGVSDIDICTELISLFVANNWSIPASTWLGLAAFVCREAGEGSGQKALTRLLMSDIAQLSSSVADGPWQQGLYPRTGSEQIVAGVIWLMLGAPKASDRWRAAHAVRCLARLERWEVIDALVARLAGTDANGYQASELKFYYLHARLWLLIALARVALNKPAGVAKYKKQLLTHSINSKSDNVLIRYFAANAILACSDAGALTLSESQVAKLRSIDKSPYPTVTIDPSRPRYRNYYQHRARGQAAPPNKFSLDYDFEKSDVQNLCTVFDQPGWMVKDMLCREAATIDSSIDGMYESGGREPPGGTSLRQDNEHHGYGFYIGWHALLGVAGDLLTGHPPVRSWAGEDPWDEWFRRRRLTCSDSLWLADGVDRPPPETQVNVLEPGPEGLVLTGDEDLLRRLIGIRGATVSSDIVIDGDWRTPDGISVHITSALVPTRKSARLTKQLINQEPFFAYLPRYYGYEDEEEHLRGEMKEYEPWIVCPEAEAGIDDLDPHGVIDVIKRPRFVSEVAKDFSIRVNDAFACDLRGRRNKRVASTQAWGQKRRYEEQLEGGTRLMCKPQFLSEVLQARKRDLLVLIKLQRYEERDSYTGNSSFLNSLAVVRISRDLNVIFKPGKANYRQKSVV